MTTMPNDNDDDGDSVDYKHVDTVAAVAAAGDAVEPYRRHRQLFRRHHFRLPRLVVMIDQGSNDPLSS
jgi:hypothetical protein